MVALLEGWSLAAALRLAQRRLGRGRWAGRRRPPTQACLPAAARAGEMASARASWLLCGCVLRVVGPAYCTIPATTYAVGEIACGSMVLYLYCVSFFALA